MFNTKYPALKIILLVAVSSYLFFDLKNGAEITADTGFNAELASSIIGYNNSEYTNPIINAIVTDNSLTTIKAILELQNKSENPIDINAVDKNGFTALHYAQFSPQASAISKLLLEHGADSSITGREGMTALATEKENNAIERIIIHAQSKKKFYKTQEPVSTEEYVTFAPRVPRRYTAIYLIMIPFSLVFTLLLSYTTREINNNTLAFTGLLYFFLPHFAAFVWYIASPFTFVFSTLVYYQIFIFSLLLLMLDGINIIIMLRIRGSRLSDQLPD